MTQQKKKSVITLIVTAVLLIVAYLPRETDFGFKTMLGATFMIMVRSLIHITLLFLWCLSVTRRVVNKKIRNLTVATGIFMALWILSKTIKWEFFPTNDGAAVRYLWYFYYVPMIIIPLLGLLIILHIDKPDNYKPPKKAYLICIPAAILLLAVFTNDLHNLVFTFPKGIEFFHADYGYGVLYWFCLAWFIVLGLTFVIMLIKKNRFPGSKSIKMLPLYIMIGAIAFWLLYTFKVINGDLTVIDCLIITALLESAIQTGLIPTNSNYRELFEKTTVPVIVVDKDYQARYVSGSALPVSEENMRSTVSGTITLDNTLLSSAPIVAGRVVWQDDVTTLNIQRQELNEICEELSEESELIKAETEIKEKQAQADEKNRLYDKIACDVSPQLEKATSLLEKAEKGENTRDCLAAVAIIGTYIKRRGNLILLGSDTISARELERAFGESLENLKLLNVETALTMQTKDDFTLEAAVKAYDTFDNIVEELFPLLNAIFVRVDKTKVSIQIGVQNENALALLSKFHKAATVEIDEEDAYIDVFLGGEDK